LFEICNLKKFLPILQWLPEYSKGNLHGDISAGLTVGVMLIPQGMAYALLAGLPPIYGLYASTIPLIIYAIFGTSRQLAVGPVAMVALLVANGVGELAPLGSEEYIALAILLAMMVGLFQLTLGIFRLGFLVNFLSNPVISGFTSAAALIIGLNQLKHLLGIEIPRNNHIHMILSHAYNAFSETNYITLSIGIGAIALIVVLKKMKSKIPGPLVTVIISILVVYIFNLDSLGVKIIGKVPGGLPTVGFPTFNVDAMQGLLPTALTIGLIGFMESIAVAKAIQLKHKNYKIDANQELIGLGLANIGGSIFRSFPVNGGYSRTAVNDQSGAKTGMASIISALLIILTLLFLTPLFYFLPKAILASVIMVAVFGLIDWKELIHLWKTDKRDFSMLLITFFTTLTFGIQQGILTGIILSMGLILFKSAYPHIAILGKIPGLNIYRNIKRFPQAKEFDNILIIRFDAQLFFANTHAFQNVIEKEVIKRKGLQKIILNAEAINSLDSSAVHILIDTIEELRKNNIKFVFACVKGPVRDIMEKNRMKDKLGDGYFYNSISEALEKHNIA